MTASANNFGQGFEFEPTQPTEEEITRQRGRRFALISAGVSATEFLLVNGSRDEDTGELRLSDFESLDPEVARTYYPVFKLIEGVEPVSGSDEAPDRKDLCDAIGIKSSELSSIVGLLEQRSRCD